jgi:CIC family chloride channel protein
MDTPHRPDLRHLGDFDVSPRMLMMVAFALPIGALVAGVAWCLLRLIGLITNLVFYDRFGTALVAPSETGHSPLLILLAPVCGGLVIGLVARFGSEKIRGHGIPEAMDSILTSGSKVQPRVALLKPIASAIAIGTGGPFGAEGPIIMTGGAFGSIIAQSLHLSADERKTLLVAGAAAGMAAVFDAPLAAVLLAIELLLFEWRPRSFVPVTAAVAVATIVRVPLLGAGPVFPVPTGTLHLDAGSYALCIVSGALAALLALISTTLVYFSEDTFSRLPIHWMWWPAIGGVIIGLGGLVVPQALGVGYDVIEAELNGTAALHLIIGILIVKTLIWSLSLGSGTSGGVLAPLLMIGAALGGLEAQIFPAVGAGFWPLVGLAAILGAAMRSPLTGVVFALELTHRYEALLPLMIGAVVAYAISVLLLRRSILTEKIARRGVHVNHEYSVDPLEVLFVADVMSEYEVGAHGEGPGSATAATVPTGARNGTNGSGPAPVVFADDTLRHVAYAMADSGRTELAVAARARPGVPIGTVRLEQLLAGRLRDLDEERHRTRVLRPLELLRIGRAPRPTGEA